MFNQRVNTMCINKPFNVAIIPGMKKMHAHMERLYAAARSLGRLSPEMEQASLARLLNVAQQNVNNWESRGLSKEGLLDAQQKLGVNATWVVTGEGPMFVGAGSVAPVEASAPAWPFKSARADYDALPVKTKADISDYIEMKIAKAKKPKSDENKRAA
jgi:hypothetical protein